MLAFHILADALRNQIDSNDLLIIVLLQIEAIQCPK